MELKISGFKEWIFIPDKSATKIVLFSYHQRIELNLINKTHLGIFKNMDCCFEKYINFAPL
jgi:hypothetical protein